MIVLCAGLMILMLRFPETSALAARDALRLWSIDVVPSLFPYMVLCRMLSGRLKQRGIREETAAAFLGLLGGSPSGAAALAGYGGQLPQKVLYALCALTGTISPMFMKGTVGSWLQGNHIGSMLLVSHFGGAVISALLIWFLFSNDKYAKGITPENDSCAFVSDPISQSIDAVFRVGGCIVFFSVLAGLIKQIPVVTPLSFALIYALLEVSGGMHAISALNLPTSCRAVLIAGFSGFSGLSILFQNFVFLAPLGVRMHTLFLLGLLRACASACIMTLLCVLTG